MKREIKFRAILNKEARNRTEEYTTGVKEFTLEDLMRQQVIFSYPEHWTFCQYTGLLDKNGKEIYEGDIVQDRDYKFLVVWTQDEAGFNFTDDKKGRITHPKGNAIMSVSIGYGRNTKIKVIGNIYENPELLK